MTDLHAALEEYLHTRRALGTQLKWPESCLHQFVDFVIAQGTDVVTTALALRWTFRPVGLQPATYARRLGLVRAFACWLHASDPRTEIPPLRLLPAPHRRPTPHICSATYFLLAELIAGGVDGVFEQHGARRRSTDFTKGEALGVRDHLIELVKPTQKPDWMSQHEYDQAPATLTIRAC